jgi:hypothetical protein
MQAATTAILALAAFLGQPGLTAAADAPSPADQWRTEHRLIDLHQHINLTTQHVTRAVKIMDAAGLGVAVNLGAGTVIRGANGTPSPLSLRHLVIGARLNGLTLQAATPCPIEPGGANEWPAPGRRGGAGDSRDAIGGKYCPKTLLPSSKRRDIYQNVRKGEIA